MPTDADFNLLVALNALLSEGSVSRAAERLGLSESAMSRTLARLRETTGDAVSYTHLTLPTILRV